MAIEAERLLAIFEARFTSLEKALQKAKAQSKDSFGSIEADGSRAENALANIGVRGTPGIDKASKSINALKGQTGNLAAQFNDIGVQLAGGQSPFLIALQQGTQINQVLGQAGAKGAVSALGGAFLSLLNPVSLATIAIIAGGGYAAQYFLSVFTGGEKSAETLKQEADLIQKVADKWGDALPALKAYADAQKEIVDNQDKLNAATAARDNAAQPLKEGLDNVEVALVQVRQDLADLGQVHTAAELEQQFEALQKKVAENSATQQDFNNVLSYAETAFASAGYGGDGFINMLRALQSQALATLPTVQSISNEIQGLSRGGPLRRFSRESAPTIELPDNAPSPDRAPNREDVGAEQDRYAASQARKASRGQKLTADDRIREDIQSLKDRTETLRAETEMVGQSYEEQQKRKMALDLEQEALGRLREEAARKGQIDLDSIKLSPQQVASIDEASAAYARQADILRQVQEQQQNAEQAAGDFYDTFKAGTIDAISGAKNLKDALIDVGKKFADLLLNSAFDSLFAPKSGTSSGGSFGGIFDAIGKLITGGFATGTRSAPGGLAWVGERGRELVNLPKGSQVVPNDLSEKLASGGNSGGSAITVAPVIHVDASNAQKGVGPEIEAAIKRATKNMTPMVVKALKDIKVKGIPV